MKNKTDKKIIIKYEKGVLFTIDPLVFFLITTITPISRKYFIDSSIKTL